VEYKWEKVRAKETERQRGKNESGDLPSLYALTALISVPHPDKTSNQIKEFFCEIFILRSAIVQKIKSIAVRK